MFTQTDKLTKAHQSKKVGPGSYGEFTTTTMDGEAKSLDEKSRKLSTATVQVQSADSRKMSSGAALTA